MKSDRIVNLLKRRRLNSGLSQKEMANRLGVTQSQYSRIESAKTEPTKYRDELGKIFILRKILAPMGTTESMEFLLEKMKIQLLKNY